MSFILDALKKSENERQRQTGPGFATVPGSSSRRTRSPWPLVLAGLVAVNLAVLGYIPPAGRWRCGFLPLTAAQPPRIGADIGEDRFGSPRIGSEADPRARRRRRDAG